MTKLRAWKEICAVLVLCVATAIAGPAQTFNTLLNFQGTNGANPNLMALVQGADGDLYGTASDVVTERGGTVFKVTPAGVLTVLYHFCPHLPSCGDGEQPYAGLVLAVDSNFYGTTHLGGVNSECGSNGCGTVFSVTSQGTLKTLYSFCAKPNCADGWHPHGVLVQGVDGNFYGTTKHGGANQVGTVFKITPGGTLITLYSFDTTNGAYPSGGLIQATDGFFYGTSSMGGDLSCEAPNGCGTIFKITPEGALTTLHEFAGVDGITPLDSLIEGNDGNLYGTTQLGGANAQGTVFSVTTEGDLTTLHSFSTTDGQPQSGLLQATDGNFYGTTSEGGSAVACPKLNCGTIFEITPEGTLTTLHNLDNSDGANPYGGLVQATNGNFYGTTYVGGADGLNDGTVFSLSMGLSPFVKTLPVAAKAGAEIGILGTQLTGVSSVTFNGTPAKFSVRSPSLILASVPTDATTGFVTVTTPSDTLTSNMPFHVIP